MPEIRARAKNTFSIRIFLGRDLDGKRHFLNKTIKGTKNDAERWANREGKVLSSNARKRLNSAREQHGKLSIVGNKTSKYWALSQKSSAPSTCASGGALLHQVGGFPKNSVGRVYSLCRIIRGTSRLTASPLFQSGFKGERSR